MIRIKGLIKKRGNFVLDIYDLDISEGKISAFVGKNGSGKTSLIELILDLILIDEGEVIIDDYKIGEGNEDWKELVGAYTNEDYLIGFLTPNEYFDIIKHLRNTDEIEFKSLLNKWENFLTTEVINSNEYIRNLSTGQKAKIGIFAAFISNPKYIFLDEPFANLDKESIEILISHFKDYIVKDRKTIILTSHNHEKVNIIADRIIEMNEGNISSINNVQKTS